MFLSVGVLALFSKFIPPAPVVSTYIPGWFRRVTLRYKGTRKTTLFSTAPRCWVRLHTCGDDSGYFTAAEEDELALSDLGELLSWRGGAGMGMYLVGCCGLLRAHQWMPPPQERVFSAVILYSGERHGKFLTLEYAAREFCWISRPRCSFAREKPY